MDTFRILMVLPSVFTRGWNSRGPILPQKSTPGGGGPKTPFSGFRGTPPTPPGRGGGGVPPPPPRVGGAPRGGVPDPPRGGYPPLPRGGKPRPKRTPPWGTPFLQPNSCKEITRGEARYRFSTHSPVPCQR